MSISNYVSPAYTIKKMEIKSSIQNISYVFI